MTIETNKLTTRLRVFSSAEADFVRMMPRVVRLAESETQLVNARLVDKILERIAVHDGWRCKDEEMFSTRFETHEVGPSVRSVPGVSHVLDMRDGTFVFAVDDDDDDGTCSKLLIAGCKGVVDFTRTVPNFDCRRGFSPVFSAVPLRLRQLFAAWVERGRTGAVLDDDTVLHSAGGTPDPFNRHWSETVADTVTSAWRAVARAAHTESSARA